MVDNGLREVCISCGVSLVRSMMMVLVVVERRDSDLSFLLEGLKELVSSIVRLLSKVISREFALSEGAW